MLYDPIVHIIHIYIFTYLIKVKESTYKFVCFWVFLALVLIQKLFTVVNADRFKLFKLNNKEQLLFKSNQN